jgi:hypothetical protein
MTIADLAIVIGLTFAWGALSAQLERFDMTTPIVFTVAGVLLTHGPLTPLGITPSKEVVKVLAEVTLVLVLLSDASRVGLHHLRADLGLCLRLLRIGLPLTIGLGTLAAFTLPGVSNIWLAVLVGAALARIDAALGAAVMVNPAVPARIRQLINVESGLNDGIATPFVLVAIARRGDCRACRQRRGPGRRGSCLTLRLPAAQRRDLSRDASRHSHAPALPARSCPPGRPPARGSRSADVPGTQATAGPLRRSSRWPRLRKRPPPTPLLDGPGRCRRRAPARRDRRAVLSGAGDSAARVPEAMEVRRARIHRGAS